MEGGAVVREVGFVYLKHDDLALTLLGVAIVFVVAHLGGLVFERAFRQPPVIGQVIAGILLGPSLLGDVSTSLFPVENRPMLRIVATLGLVTFMFLVGLQMDLGHLRAGGQRIAAAVGLCGTVIPFALGVALAPALHGSHDLTSFWPFALFIGAALSITAFPVLARILIERDLYDKPIGVVTMASAAVDDILTWATLALVVGLVVSDDPWDLPYIAALAAIFATVMIAVVRPRLSAYKDRGIEATHLWIVMAAILLSSFVTSTIGLHEIFGAFLLGAVVPRGRLAGELGRHLEPLAAILLPVFFVTTGLNVDIGGLGWQGSWQLGLILATACAGKIGGAFLGGRSQRLQVRDALGLGVLMNTRGLTELVVLDIGLDVGVLDAELFTAFVVMAVVTTVATAPLLAVVKPDPSLGRSS